MTGMYGFAPNRIAIPDLVVADTDDEGSSAGCLGVVVSGAYQAAPFVLAVADLHVAVVDRRDPTAARDVCAAAPLPGVDLRPVLALN